jgi:hypothetical protein
MSPRLTARCHGRQGTCAGAITGEEHAHYHFDSLEEGLTGLTVMLSGGAATAYQSRHVRVRYAPHRSQHYHDETALVAVRNRRRQPRTRLPATRPLPGRG